MPNKAELSVDALFLPSHDPLTKSKLARKRPPLLNL